jgi:hypothetical protein
VVIASCLGYSFLVDDIHLKAECKGKRTFHKSNNTFDKFNKNLIIFLIALGKAQIKDIAAISMRKCKANSN